MSINMDELRRELIRDEGVVYSIYKDPLGYPTFGIGHLITPSDPEYNMPIGTPVSEERVYEVFEKDVDIAIEDCKILYGDDFDDWPSCVKHVLVNMCFNLGRSRLSRFVRMKKALHERDWVVAAKEGRDSRWYNQVTTRAERLMKRLEAV